MALTLWSVMHVFGKEFLSEDLPKFESAIARIPSEIRTANIIEVYFQTLPEETPLPAAVKVPIFIYHSVRPHIAGESSKQDAYDITPELLEQELVYLRDNGYTTITPDTLAADIKAGTTSPIAKPVMLTFDDGWENQYTYAFPLLKKYNVTATFYVYTNPISKQKHFFTWDEIKEMSDAGMTIADHTLSHPYLKKLPLDEFRREVTESKAILEQHLGKPVTHFASPFGYTDADFIQILGQAGYTTARTTYKGVYQDNALRLRGILTTDSMDYFVSMLKR